MGNILLSIIIKKTIITLCLEKLYFFYYNGYSNSIVLVKKSLLIQANITLNNYTKDFNDAKKATYQLKGTNLNGIFFSAKVFDTYDILWRRIYLRGR